MASAASSTREIFHLLHTFNNSCGGNRNDATAMEPGSGSSIMAYAGICPSNVQNNSDDHFHGISLQQMGIEILSAGHTCEQTSALSNNPVCSVAYILGERERLYTWR